MALHNVKTALRDRYQRAAKLDEAGQTNECVEYLQNPEILVAEFADSYLTASEYDRSDQEFWSPPEDLPPAARVEIEQCTAAGYPREACGLLVGVVGSGTVEVTRVAPARNLARESDRFELDPADWLAAHDEARLEGHQIVGVWHAHPDHPAEPSPADAEAAWGGYSYLIVSVAAGGVTELRCWRLQGRAFAEQGIEP